MYKIVTNRRFLKQLNKCLKKKGNTQAAFVEVYRQLERYGCVDDKYRPHMLSGNLSGHWECHIRPDWLLVWVKRDREIEIELTHTGSHSELFK